MKSENRGWRRTDAAKVFSGHGFGSLSNSELGNRPEENADLAWALLKHLSEARGVNSVWAEWEESLGFTGWFYPPVVSPVSVTRLFPYQLVRMLLALTGEIFTRKAEGRCSQSVSIP